MDVKIKETGKIESLGIIDRSSGVNWVTDLIGNTGALSDGQFAWSEEDNAYITDQDTYDWWAEYISDTEQTESDVTETAEKLGIDESVIWERIHNDVGNDYDDHRSSALRAIEEIKEEYTKPSSRTFQQRLEDWSQFIGQ